MESAVRGLEIAQRIPASHCQITLTVASSHNFLVKLQWEIKSGEITAESDPARFVSNFWQESVKNSHADMLSKLRETVAQAGGENKLYSELYLKM